VNAIDINRTAVPLSPRLDIEGYGGNRHAPPRARPRPPTDHHMPASLSLLAAVAGDSALLICLELWLNGLMLSKLHCNKPGWLASSAGRGFASRRCRYVKLRFLHAMRLNSRAGTEGSHVSSLK